MGPAEMCFAVLLLCSCASLLSGAASYPYEIPASLIISVAALPTSEFAPRAEQIGSSRESSFNVLMHRAKRATMNNSPVEFSPGHSGLATANQSPPFNPVFHTNYPHVLLHYIHKGHKPGSSKRSILLPIYSLSLLWTCPNHLSLASLTLSPRPLTCNLPLMYSFLILSIPVTPNVNLSILISAISSSASCLFLSGTVSRPNNMVPDPDPIHPGHSQ
nr:uncharacterized protein LOC131138124 isoform X2 [Doryrhamphus excisus]